MSEPANVLPFRRPDKPFTLNCYLCNWVQTWSNEDAAYTAGSWHLYEDHDHGGHLTAPTQLPEELGHRIG